ncbi:MAG: hypothetical protein H6767_07605 [Candidatus Peribacteria bacterium]|nr:MAG: hypothetical protein H6767_07605 [Candidatus Peribacteria bacterium]
MEIRYETEQDYRQVVAVIERNGFSVQEDQGDQGTNSQTNFLLNVIAILIVVILYIFSTIFDLNRYIPDINTLSYSSAFLVGIIASISTCLAIT